jgi:hypothetical protein
VRRKMLLSVVSTVLALMCVGVLVTKGGKSKDNHDHDTAVTARPAVSSPSVPPPVYVMGDLRDAMPEPVDAGKGWHRLRKIMHGRPHNLVMGPGVPACHQTGIDIGKMEEYELKVTTKTFADGWYIQDLLYTAGAVYPDIAGAERVMGTIRSAVAACPSRYEQPRMASGRWMMPGSAQTWTPQPEAVVGNWRRLRVLETRTYDRKLSPRMVRIVTDYVVRGNAVMVQQLSGLNMPGTSFAQLEARSNALLGAMLARVDAPDSSGVSPSPIGTATPSTGAPCATTIGGLGCEIK